MTVNSKQITAYQPRRKPLSIGPMRAKIRQKTKYMYEPYHDWSFSPNMWEGGQKARGAT